MRTPTADKIAYNQREAARALGVSQRTLQRWTKDGTITATRIGQIVLYPADQLRQRIAALVQLQPATSRE